MPLAEHLLPFLTAVFLWWFSTGAILWLDRQPRRTFPWSMAAATALLGLAVFGLWASAERATPMGAYVAFLSALAVWGWHEMAFLMGYLTGPRRAPCPPDARGWRRFRLATATLIHHEIALAATCMALFALTWQAANPIGAWTFAILFAMRLSAKLNVFFGVPHFADDLLPPALSYLKTYLRAAPMTPLLPLSVAAGLAGAAWFGVQAFTGGADPFIASGFTLLMGLTLLGVLEHLFFILPIQETALWRWAMPAAAPARPIE